MVLNYLFFNIIYTVEAFCFCLFGIGISYLFFNYWRVINNFWFGEVVNNGSNIFNQCFGNLFNFRFGKTCLICVMTF